MEDIFDRFAAWREKLNDRIPAARFADQKLMVVAHAEFPQVLHDRVISPDGRVIRKTTLFQGSIRVMTPSSLGGSSILTVSITIDVQAPDIETYMFTAEKALGVVFGK